MVNGPLSRFRPTGLWSDKQTKPIEGLYKTKESTQSIFRDKPNPKPNSNSSNNNNINNNSKSRRRSSSLPRLKTPRSRADEKTIKEAISSDTTTTAGSFNSKNNTNSTTSANSSDGSSIGIPIFTVLPPPDLERLSKAGCRCLAIDLPGVLSENLTITYQAGYVRVKGWRTIGQSKPFRKRIPNPFKDQIVPELMTAYLNAGVLLVVAPIQRAVRAAQMAIVMARIAAAVSWKLHPAPPVKLLTYGAAWKQHDHQQETKESTEYKLKSNTSSRTSSYTKSAFAPYVTPTTQKKYTHVAEFDSPDTISTAAEEETSEDDNESTDELTELIRSCNNNYEVPEFDWNEEEEEDNGKDKDITTATTKVGWTDDSLMDEPSEDPILHPQLGSLEPTSTTSRSSNRKDEPSTIFRPSPPMSPSKTHMDAVPTMNGVEYVDSPGIRASVNQAARPLTILQYRREQAWLSKNDYDYNDEEQEYESNNDKECKMEDDEVNRLPKLPFQYELSSLNNSMDSGLGTELEPHPYWRSAPFLPSIASLEGYKSTNTTTYTGSISRPNERKPWHLTPRSHPPSRNIPSNSNKPPSPSSLLKTKESFPTYSSSRSKRVTWIDEI